MPLIALVFFIGSAFMQGDTGFQVDKTQRGLLISRVFAPVNPVRRGELIVDLQGVAYPRTLGYLFSSAMRQKGLQVMADRGGATFRFTVNTVPLTLTRLEVLAGPRFALIFFFL